MLKRFIALLITILMIYSSITTALALSPPYVSGIMIDGPSEIFMSVGETIELEALATPVGVDYAYITWIADKENIVDLLAEPAETTLSFTLSHAEVTALVTGEVTLTAYVALHPEVDENNYEDYANVKITIVEPENEIPFESGDGSESNPYIINTADQLAYLAQRVNEGSLSLSRKSYKLGRDIDLSAYGKDYNDGKGWTPIGISGNENGDPKHFTFKGVFDGNGHKITGLYINDPVVSYDNYSNAVGLFGVAEDCTIRNLRVVNAYVFGGGLAHTGTIVGYLQRGVVENCYATGTAGYATYDGPIEGSPPSGGGGSVGGLVGNVDDSEVRNSYSAVDVINGWYAGGIASTIDCGGSIINCYSTGDVNGSAYVGGIAGINWDPSEQPVDGKIENCYSTGSVTGGDDYVEDYTGGIIGYADSVSVTNCAALNPCIKGDENVSRIAGLHHFYKDSVMSGNYALDTIKDTNGETAQWTNKGHDQFDGEDMPENDAKSDSFWRDTMGFDSKVWQIRSFELPKLPIVLSVISDIKEVYRTTAKFEYNGNRTWLEVVLRDLNSMLAKSGIIPKFSNVELNDVITQEAKEDESIFAFNLDDENGCDYTGFIPLRITIEPPAIGGGTAIRIGKDYRLYRLENDALVPVDEFKSNAWSVEFNANKLGTYVLYFNPACYNVTFYMGAPTYDDDGNSINSEVHKIISDLKSRDIVEFPEIPKKDGYVFTGWKAWRGSGVFYTYPQPLTANSHIEYYASWCPKDEYEPINISISSDGVLLKGQEDGKKITLKTNYGIFEEGQYFPSEWRSKYDRATSEREKADILAEWKEKWNVVGSDDVMVESAERIDDKTVELTLSGNSTDTIHSSNIYIEFIYEILLPEPHEVNGEIVYYGDTKIKMDEDGVRAKMYRSDNSVALALQGGSRTGGGGGGAITAPTASLKSGEVAKNSLLKLSTTYSDAKIYYTTDGSTPTKDSTEYASPIVIDKSMTVKYMVVTAKGPSRVITATYTVKTADITFNENTFKYIRGYEDNNFNPDQAITRYEMLESLERLLDIERIETDKAFPDVPEDKKSLVALFAGVGIIDGFDDGTFKGNEGLTRAEFVKVMSIILNLAPESKSAAFDDAADHWAENYIAAFETLGYLKGYDDGSFRPDNKISRAEFVAVINRIIKNNSEPVNNEFSDLDNSHWAFEEIRKAVLENQN